MPRPVASRRRILVAAVTAALVALGALAAGPAGAAVAPAASGEAAGAPGALSHFDLARKDCIGTARTSTSKVWYTVAGGVLSDVYYPTIDTTNVETMQYLVTDGSTFTDLQTRDMTYTVAADPTGMACTVTATAKSGRYRLVTRYVTDPARAAVVARTTLQPLSGTLADYRLYVRLDPTVGGNGGGGTGNGGADDAVVTRTRGDLALVAGDPVTATDAANRDYAVPTYLALRATPGLTNGTAGFAGTASDPQVLLDGRRRLDPAAGSATRGNVVLGARVALDGTGAATLALGLGTSRADAIGVSGSAAAQSFDTTAVLYAAGWQAYDATLRPPPAALPGVSGTTLARLRTAYTLSANVLKASEDKTFPGAVVASLASPWGQAVSAGDPANTYFGSYREVFARDLYQAFTGLVADGDLASAQDAVRFLLLRQQLPDGSMPRNSLLNGGPRRTPSTPSSTSAPTRS